MYLLVDIGWRQTVASNPNPAFFPVKHLLNCDYPF